MRLDPGGLGAVLFGCQLESRSLTVTMRPTLGAVVHSHRESSDECYSVVRWSNDEDAKSSLRTRLGRWAAVRQPESQRPGSARLIVENAKDEYVLAAAIEFSLNTEMQATV